MIGMMQRDARRSTPRIGERPYKDLPNLVKTGGRTDTPKNRGPRHHWTDLLFAGAVIVCAIVAWVLAKHGHI